MINSKLKGKRGELSFVKLLERNGFEARRGQQFHGGPDSPDIFCDIPFHFEVKSTETLQLEKAYNQAVRECPVNQTPCVAHKRKRGEWRVTLSGDDFFALLRKLPPG